MRRDIGTFAGDRFARNARVGSTAGGYLRD